MKLKDLTDVLKFEAFRPEPDDSTAPWRTRFPSKRTLLTNVSRRQVSWRLMERNGALGVANTMDGELRDVLQQVGQEWRDATEGGWCSVSLNNRFVISLEANLSRRKGLDELLRTNPKAALGAKAERGKRYALQHNPESNTSLLLAADEEAVTRLEASMKETGLQPGRVCVGTFAMLLELIDQVRDARRVHLSQNGDAKTGSILMIACCEGSLCALLQQEEQWLKLRSRAELYTAEDMSPAIELVVPMIEEAGPDTHVLFMSDAEGSAFPKLLQARMPQLRLSDVTAPNQLWNLIGDL
jgi:hypothetical protein